MLNRLNFSCFILCILILLGVSSCSVQNRTANKPIQLTEDVLYHLQPVSITELGTGVQSVITVEYNGTTKQLITQTEITNHQIKMVGFTVEGISLFSIDWNMENGQLFIEKEIPIALEPERILAEYQLTALPIIRINAGLVGAKAIDAEKGVRKIMDIDNNFLYSIENKHKHSSIKNEKLDYLITIQELDKWSLAE